MSLADRLRGEEELVVRGGLDDPALAQRGGGVRGGGGSVGGLGGHLAAIGYLSARVESNVRTCGVEYLQEMLGWFIQLIQKDGLFMALRGKREVVRLAELSHQHGGRRGRRN